MYEINKGLMKRWNDIIILCCVILFSIKHILSDIIVGRLKICKQIDRRKRKNKRKDKEFS